MRNGLGNDALHFMPLDDIPIRQADDYSFRIGLDNLRAQFAFIGLYFDVHYWFSFFGCGQEAIPTSLK